MINTFLGLLFSRSSLLAGFSKKQHPQCLPLKQSKQNHLVPGASPQGVQGVMTVTRLKDAVFSEAFGKSENLTLVWEFLLQGNKLCISRWC